MRYRPRRPSATFGVMSATEAAIARLKRVLELGIRQMVSRAVSVTLKACVYLARAMAMSKPLRHWQDRNNLSGAVLQHRATAGKRASDPRTDFIRKRANYHGSSS